MNLYEHHQLAQLEAHIDYDTGEVNIEAFENSQIALKDKQLAVCAYLKNESARIDMLDNAIKELNDRKKAMQNRNDGLKNYLLINMQANGITEIVSNDLTFSAKIKKNPPKLVIDDAGKIPCELYFYPEAPPPHPDNAKIKEKLKLGEVVEGAHLESGERLDIK